MPAIIYLALSHHSEQRRARTIGFRIFNWEQRFCTRCTAQWLSCGLTAGVWTVFQPQLPAELWFVLLAFTPFPSTIDWLTQTWGYRESSTAIRLAAGTLLGTGFGMELAAVIALDVFRIGIGLGVCVVYVVAICSLLKLRPAHVGYMEDLIAEFSLALTRFRSR